MSGGGYRGRSFGQYGARYNNLRTRGYDNASRSSGRSKEDKKHSSRSYSRENFDSSTSSSRRNGRSRNENWSGSRTFTRWDQTSNNPQPSPSSSSPSSSSSSSSPSSSSSLLSHNQAAWSRNHNEHYQNNGSLRFQYRNDSQYHNRGGRGYFSRGDYRFSNQRGSQNYFSSYYSAPFRENSYDQQDKDSSTKEPIVPLLGSEEERQQKITEAADELKRKLLFSTTNDNIEVTTLGDNNFILQSSHHNDKSNKKSIHSSPKLHTRPNNFEMNSGTLNEEYTIFPIKLIDCVEGDKKDELTPTALTYDSIEDSGSVNTNIIVIPTSKVDISDKGDEGINRQILEASYTVEASHNSVDPGVHGIRESFNELTSESSNPMAQRVEVRKYSSTNKESRQTIITNDSYNFAVSIGVSSNNIGIMNAEVSDLATTNSPIIESSNVSENNQITSDITVSSENSILQMPFLAYSTVHNLSEKKELNLIEYLQKQVEISKIKSPSLSIVEREKMKDTSELNNESIKNIALFSTSSNYSQDNNSQYGGPTIISHNYSQIDILQPPPLPPTLPPPSYESTESCLNPIVPEFDSAIRPSNNSSPCDTIRQSSTFDTQHATISPIMSTAPTINSSMNIAAPVSNYEMGHQNYVPLTSYDPGVSLAYPPAISSLDYTTSQAIMPSSLTLSNSSSIRSLILQDVCATNVNEDDDVLHELKEAMEFAKQCMVMGNDDNEAEEEDIEFPTFPDLPPVMPTTMPIEKFKGVKKNSRTKNVKQTMLNELLNTATEAKTRTVDANVTTASNVDEIPNELKTGFSNRRKVVFNLNSRCKLLNKNDGIWLDELTEETRPMPRSKWQRLTPIPVIESQIEKNEKSKRNLQVKKTKEPEIYKELERTKETENIKESRRTKNLERTRESEWIKVSEKTKRPEKSLVCDDKNDKNSHRKTTDSNRACDKNQRDPKKSPNEQILLINDAMKDDQHPNLTRPQKPEKTSSNGMKIINVQSNDTKTQISYSNKSSSKMTAPKLLTKSTWKDRVIGRFLKMSKNDIQNMINNSSLRKFDIAMQHLVKEKKSSLSLKMRNHEDEKMKTSTYDNEDFMTQLQAILDPAATVDITDLPTNFIHQLSAVLHLDSSPATESFSINNNEKKVESVELSTSTSTKIDPKKINNSSRMIGTNTPFIAIHDISKSQKIDNRVSKGIVKNTSSTMPAAATCIRTKVKRGRIDNANIQCNTNEMKLLSLPLLSLIEDENELDVDELDELIETGVTSAKTIEISPDNIKSLAPPLPLNKTPTVIIKRILLTDSEAATSTTPTITTTTTSTTLPRMETLNVMPMARQTMESENCLITDIFKSESASSVRTSIVDSTIGEIAHETRIRKTLRHEVTRNDTSDNMMQWEDTDDGNLYRNVTKVEYKTHHGGPVSHSAYETGYRKITPVQSRKIDVNDREVIPHSVHINEATYEPHLQSHMSSQNSPNRREIRDTGSDSQCNSDTSTSSSSNSNSDLEPSLLDVTKVLKFIKQREKMAKKKTINEEIRDEVAAEIEKHRKEKSVKHRLHKSRSKKRDKRKKEKKGKKKKSKKKKRHKTHHLSHSDDDIMEREELPLRLLTNDEIKREVEYDEPSKTIIEVSRPTVQLQQSAVSTTKISTESANSTLINRSFGSEPTMSTSQISVTSVITTIMPTITSTPALITSEFKSNSIKDSPSLIVTVVNTSVANANTSVSSVIKTTLTSTTTSPLRTVTAVSLPCSTTPQLPILQPKTKAQLKQMPDAVKTTQSIDTKLIKSTLIEPKLIEPVSSMMENQIISEPRTSSPTKTSSISTTSMSMTQTGPKKLDIKAYQQRALQRKLKEEEKMRNLIEDPTQLTQNLLRLPVKKQPQPVDDAPRCVNGSEISSTMVKLNNIDQPNADTIITPPAAIGNLQTKNPKHIHSKLLSLPSKLNIDELNLMPLIALSQTRSKLNQMSATNLFDTNCLMSNTKTIEKFINIKSEGGKELKLREKVKKRPQKVVAPLKTTSVQIDVGMKKKIMPTTRHRQKNSSLLVETSKNIDDQINSTNNIEIPINNPLLSVNIPIDDAKDNHEDKNLYGNNGANAMDIVQMFPKTNEHSPQNNNFTMVDEKLSATVESTKKPDHTNLEQALSHQSHSINKEFSLSENLDVISTFSHYFKSTEGLISDGLPDTVAQEQMVIHITPQLQEIVGAKEIVKINDTYAIQHKSAHPNDNRITTKHVSVIDNSKISSQLIKSISVDNDELEKKFNIANNLSKVLEPSVIVSDIFNNEFSDAPSLPSTSISETDIQSLLTVSTVTTESINSRESIIAVSESTPTDLLESTELSHVNTAISSAYPHFNIQRQKSQSLEQLTLDDLSDISMDRSTLSDQKEDLQTVSVSNTVLLSQHQNNMVNLFEKDVILIASEKGNAKFTTVENEVDNWEGCTHDTEDNSIPDNGMNDESPQNNGIKISDHVLLPDNCYKEYSQQSVVLHDRVLSMEEPKNSFLDDPITFSNTKSPTPEPIEYGVLGDNDIMAESIYNNHPLEETSKDDTLDDVMSTNNAFIQDEEASNCFANASLNNPCLPKSPSMSTSLLLDKNIVHSSSIHNRDLIKVVEGTSSERLPSPILEVSLNSNESKEKNGDNNGMIDDNNICISNNNTKVNAKENQDHQLEVETIVNDFELMKENCVTNECAKYVKTSDFDFDDSSTNKLLNDSNQPVIESSTSTTRIIKTNSSGRDENERSSSETRSIEQGRTRREISFIASTTQEKSRHKRGDRDHYSSRKTSSSKSSMLTFDHKKNKKHDYDRNKHKLTLGRVEEAITANLVSKPTTKDDVMSRMREIDIAIQRLMNEKMQLYKMIQTDEWPVNQDVETLNEFSIVKTKSHQSSRQNDKTSKVKEPRVIVSRLVDTANVKRSSVTELSLSKSQKPNTKKPETRKIQKSVAKSDEKCAKKFEGGSCKISNKRKCLLDHKDSHRSKQTRRDESPFAKKQVSSCESSRDKNKSPQSKNSESEHRKPVKLSQILARKFKPKVNVGVRRCVSPMNNDEKLMPKSFVKNEDKITHSVSMDTSKLSLSDHESSDEMESRHFVPPTNITPYHDQNDAIYSDESSWDVVDQSTSRMERSTGLSLLEQSINREMAARLSKSTEFKTKSSAKYSKDELSLPTNADAVPIPSSRSVSKKKQQRKKYQQSHINQSPNETSNHILEVIDAVAKNRINDLYLEHQTSEEKQKTSKKSEKLSNHDKKESEIKSVIPMDESGALLKKTKRGNDLVRGIAEVELRIPLVDFTQSALPQFIPESIVKCRDYEKNYDALPWSTLDSINYNDEKDVDNSTRCSDTPERIIEQSKNIQKTSSDVVNNEEHTLQTVICVLQRNSDVRNDDNMEIMSPKCDDKVQDEKDDVRKCNTQREILNNWQNSADKSHHKLDYSYDKNQETVSTAVEETASEMISLPLASTNVNSDIVSKYHAIPVIEKSVIVDFTPTTIIEQHDSRNLGKNKLDDDFFSEELVIEDSITHHSSVNSHDNQSNQFKSAENELKMPLSMIDELRASKSNLEKVESPNFSDKEIGRPKSAIKELGRSKSTGKKNGKSKSIAKELSGSRTTIEQLTLTVKDVDHLKSTLKELNKSKLAVVEIERSKSIAEDLNRPKLTVQELDRSKSLVKASERSKSMVEESGKSKSIAEEMEKSKLTLKDEERPNSVVKESERSKLTIKEPEKPKSTIKEIEKLKSTVKEHDQIKPIVREILKSKSEVKENDRPKSATKEFEQSKSMVKELERSKSTVKGIENVESFDHKSNEDDDNDGDELAHVKRDRQFKRRKQMSGRRSSRQSDDSFKTTSGSKSSHKRITESPNSHDRSTPDVEQKVRSNSNNFSSLINSKKKWDTISNVEIKTNDKSITIRRGRKRKITIEHTYEQMTNCKVQLVDCKNLYLRCNSRSDMLQRLGIMRINTWPPSTRREPTPERSASEESAIMADEDRNRSDDESMEIIQVDESMDLQSMTSPESSADIMIRDPLFITPRLSPQYNLSPRNDNRTVIIDAANGKETKGDTNTLSDYVKVLEARTATSVNNPLSLDKKNDDELQTMQYTVHKGPILDIKVFGDSFLAASEDGSIYRYCQRSNGILNIYKGHEAAITCLYVHEVPATPDSGNIRWNLFSGSLDATLRCYDIINGSLDRHIANVGSPIQCMDHAWGMIFVGTKSGHISRYDIKSGCLRDDNLDFSDKPVLALRASTEGARRILIIASRNQPITIRDAQNGLYLRTISSQRTHTVYSLMRDRNLVYCGTSSTSIPVFDFISGEQVIQYTAGVGIVCMRLYRQLLFAGCYDGNIYVFDTKDNKLICSIPGPGNMLLSMEIVGDKIIAGSKDRRLHSWRMPIQARRILAERA